MHHLNSILFAEKYNYTQSAISQTVKNFEKELGMPLFIRTKSGMQLMPNTESIVESLRKICHEEQMIQKTADRLTSLESGYIRIGSAQSISYHWLPDILREFSEEYPNIIFDVTIGGSQELIDKLNDNELDVIFVSNYNIPQNVMFYPLGYDELMLLTSRNHPLAKQITVSIHDIANEEFISNVDKHLRSSAASSLPDTLRYLCPPIYRTFSAYTWSRRKKGSKTQVITLPVSCFLLSFLQNMNAHLYHHSVPDEMRLQADCPVWRPQLFRLLRQVSPPPHRHRQYMAHG